MTNHIYKISMLIVLISFVISACASNDWKENQKAIIGGTGGAVAGGLIASALDANTAGVLGGIIAGGLVGGAIGDRIDAADRREANRATHSALETVPSGQSIQWNNPDSRNHGAVTPTKTFQAQNGQYCREYKQTATVGGEVQTVYGTACRQSDGTWKIIQ